MDHRWLMGAVCKDVAGSHIWTKVMTVTATKQFWFLKRIMFVHSLAIRRGAKGYGARLSLTDWQTECQRMMLLMYVWEEMESATNSTGDRLFECDLLEKLKKNIIEGSLNLILYNLNFRSYTTNNVFQTLMSLVEFCNWGWLIDLFCPSYRSLGLSTLWVGSFYRSISYSSYKTQPH